MANRNGRPRRTDADRAYLLALGARIVEVRNRRQWSRRELSEAAQLSEETLHHYEHGSKMPTVASALRLAKALDVGLGWLLKGPKENVAAAANDKGQA
jgi:transcriptional regulator with XRE-family HTH domain